MSDDESLDEFYAEFNDIVNSDYNLGEITINLKLLGKFLDL